MSARWWLLRLCLGWLTVCAVVAVFVDFLPIADYRAMDLRARPWPPVGFGGDWSHPLGTDELGRDVLARVIESVRVSFALARALALSASEHGYVEAVRGLGAGPGRIYLAHVLPNAASPLIVNATLNFPETILLESSLSFLGIGIQPPMVSLGNMVGYGQEFLTTGWWIAAAPTVVIFLSTISMGVLGDALRDRLDSSHR